MRCIVTYIQYAIILTAWLRVSDDMRCTHLYVLAAAAQS